MHYIMNKNTPVIEVETARILDENKCPCSLKLNNLKTSTIYNWIKQRALPYNRKHLHEIYETVNLDSYNNEIELMYKTHAVSINDNYWIASDTENQKLVYDDISLFNNRFNTSTSEIALTGQTKQQNKVETVLDRDKLTSAEYTGQGTFPKCFIREADEIYMYKSGTIDNIKNEIYAGYITELLGVNTVHYEYATLYDTECTKSRIVTTKDINWETAFIMSEFLGEYGYTPQSYAEKYLTQDYTNMIILDAIILNDDRHMKNWSFQFNSDNNTEIGLSPIYDYNNAFTATDKTLSNLIFDDCKKPVNILKAGRIAYERYSSTLKLKELADRIVDINIPINKQALKNRIEYIVGFKDNQRGCY